MLTTRINTSTNRAGRADPVAHLVVQIGMIQQFQMMHRAEVPPAAEWKLGVAHLATTRGARFADEQIAHGDAEWMPWMAGDRCGDEVMARSLEQRKLAGPTGKERVEVGALPVFVAQRAEP
jgi:hypothetical protein